MYHISNNLRGVKLHKPFSLYLTKGERTSGSRSTTSVSASASGGGGRESAGYMISLCLHVSDKTGAVGEYSGGDREGVEVHEHVMHTLYMYSVVQ